MFAADSAFKEVLKSEVLSTSPEGEAVYEIDLEGHESVFVRFPEKFLKTDFENTTLLSIGTPNTKILYQGENWLDITSVEIEDHDGLKMLAVNFLAESDTVVPHMPKLQIGEQKAGGFYSIYYDEDMNFTDGRFLFTLPENFNNQEIFLSFETVLQKAPSELALIQD